MGKPDPSASPPYTAPAGRPSADAVSLHSQVADRYVDEDAPELEVDDLPPLYSDHDHQSDDLLLPTADPPNLIPYRIEDVNTGAKYYVSDRLDSDPEYLEEHVNHWAAQPPRLWVRARGTHRHTVHKGNKKETNTVTDFEIKIEITPYLFSDATNRVSWQGLRTVENDEKTKRGTIFKCRAPGMTQNIEVGGDAKPTLLEWCHRYHASSGGLKAFTLRRRVVGFDEEKVSQKIHALIRGTSYRGHVAVDFPMTNEIVEIYNSCKTNSWRLTTWIQWLCMFTLMFIFTWPYLFFRTKRFEVVIAEWPFSRLKPNSGKEYVSVSEDQFYNMWGRALSRAILEKRQCTLDQQDLIAAEGAEPNFASGNSTVDGALGVFRAGINAMNEGVLFNSRSAFIIPPSRRGSGCFMAR